MNRSAMNWVRRVLVFVALLLACAVHTAAAEDASDTGRSVTISSSIEFAENSGASDAVKAECTLDTRLPKFIQTYAKKQNVTVVIDDGGTGAVLHLKFITIVGPRGGAWSGAKSVTVEGKLTENGKVIGTFIGSRYSGGGMFGGCKGTCSILRPLHQDAWTRYRNVAGQSDDGRQARQLLSTLQRNPVGDPRTCA